MGGILRRLQKATETYETYSQIRKSTREIDTKVGKTTTEAAHNRMYPIT